MHYIFIFKFHMKSLSAIIITALKRSLGQGNIFRSVCQEFCSQGASASVHAGIPPPNQADTPSWDQAPRRPDTPPRTRQAHPPEQAGTSPGPGPPRTRHPSLGPGRHPPPRTGRHPPEPGTPPRTSPPLPEQSLLGDTVNERAVCILLECNLFTVFSPVYYMGMYWSSE